MKYTAEQIEEKVIDCIHAFGFGKEKIISSSTKPYDELGMDSLDMLELIEAVETQLEVIVDTSNHVHLTLTTVNDIVELFKKQF